MKTLLAAVALSLVLAGASSAADPAAPEPTLAGLDRDVQDLERRLQEADDRFGRIERRLDDLEERLGESRGTVSPFDTVERRLEELEEDVDRLKR